MKLLIFLLASLPVLAADAKIFDVRKAEVRRLLLNREYSSALLKASALNKEWPDDQVGYQLLASAQLGLGKYADAEKSVQWMLDLRIGKADAQGWFLISQFREVTGDLEGAVEAANLAYNRAFPVDISLSQVLLIHSARLQRQLGKLAAADKLLITALERDASSDIALEQLALLRNEQQRKAEAISILKPLAETKGKTNPRLQYELALVSGSPDDYKTFEQSALLRVLVADNANRELSLYYSGVGNRPAEAERIARLQTTRTQDVLTQDALAMALWINHKTEEGRAMMKQVMEIGTREPSILAHAKLMGVEVE